MASASREMEGRSAIVTGGAKGLGRAIASLLVERGARVAAIDIDEPGLASLEKDLGVGVIGIAGDIRRQPGARAAIAAAVEALGQLDILVNNAGVYPRKPLFEIDDEAWDYTFDVNLRGMYHVTAAA